MIKICEKQYDASTVVQVVHENIVPIQPVESGFDVQDSIRKDPLQIVVEVIIFEEGGTLHGQWGCERIDGRMVCDELTGVAPDVGTYKYLVELRDNREIFLLDCSDYARDAAMIYPDMAITQIGHRVQRGGTYRCVVMFTQITKHFIATTDLYVQEYDIDGEPHIRWSKEPFDPSNIEDSDAVDERVLVGGPMIAREEYVDAPDPAGYVYDAVTSWCGRRLSGLSDVWSLMGG